MTANYTIFKVVRGNDQLVQWFFYQEGQLEAFGVEPNGAWYDQYYADKQIFQNLDKLEGTEHYELLNQDSHLYDYLVAYELPPSLILLPHQKTDE